MIWGAESVCKYRHGCYQQRFLISDRWWLIECVIRSFITEHIKPSSMLQIHGHKRHHCRHKITFSDWGTEGKGMKKVWRSCPPPEFMHKTTHAVRKMRGRFKVRNKCAPHKFLPRPASAAVTEIRRLNKAPVQQMAQSPPYSCPVPLFHNFPHLCDFLWWWWWWRSV